MKYIDTSIDITRPVNVLTLEGTKHYPMALEFQKVTILTQKLILVFRNMYKHIGLTKTKMVSLPYSQTKMSSNVLFN